MASIEGEIVKKRSIEGDVKVTIAATPDIHIGETVTLDNGSQAYVELAEGSTKLNPILNFGIPTGEQGPVGPQGDPGQPGKDGYTPVKGVDYFDGDQGPVGPQGENYEITEDDYTTIGNKVIEEITPTLESNLEEAKNYADDIKPTKTSELTNDSKFAVTDQNNNFSTSQTVNGTLTVNGNIVQNGESYETHAEKVFTKDDEIITRDGAVGGLSEGSYAGIIAKKYDGTNDGRLGFNAAGEAKVGDVGDEQPLLTRDEVANLKEGQVLVWDGTKLRAVGSDDFVKNTDYATGSKAGVVKTSINYGTAMNGDTIIISAATEAMIDAKDNGRCPIVPSRLNYAVGSVKASETQSGTIKAWISTENGETGLNISTEV